MSFTTLNGFLDQLTIIFRKKQTQEIQSCLSQLSQILLQASIQSEAKNKCFFKQWNEIAIPLEFIDLDYIAHLLSLYTKVNDALKEDILLDLIWPLILNEIEDEKVIIEFFNNLKVIYSRYTREQLKNFGFLDIVKYMLKTTEFDGKLCCLQHMQSNHQDDKVAVIPHSTYCKFQQFILLIQNIFESLQKEFKQSTGINFSEIEALLAISIHQLLSYCTKDHNPCQVQQLLNIIMIQLLQLSQDTISKMFVNFESVSFIVLLYNQTNYQEQRVTCLKILQIITTHNNNLLQRLVLSLSPTDKVCDFLTYEPLMATLIEWCFMSKVIIKVSEYCIFDENLNFKNSEVFELILNYLYKSPRMIQQKLIASLYTMTRSNYANQLFIIKHNHFLSSFPKFLMEILDKEEDSMIKSILDTGLKIISTVFLYSMNNGKVDLLFQWIRQIDNSFDAYQNKKTTVLFKQQLFQYIFGQILKISINNLNDFLNPIIFKGFSLYMVSFQSYLQKSLINQNPIVQRLGKFKYSPLVFICGLLDKDEWEEYQFVGRVESICNILYNHSIQMNLNLNKPNLGFKVNEFSNWINYLFQKIIGGEKDNIFLLRVIQTIISQFQYYAVTQPFSQKYLEQIVSLLEVYHQLMIAIICGCQQLKSSKGISSELEQQIIQSHYFYIESQMKLISQIREKCNKEKTLNDDAFFNQLEQKYNLQELITQIQIQLTDYYIKCVKLCQIYGKKTQTFLWNFCYEIIRIKKQEGEILESFLQTLINQPEIISEIIISEEMIIYFQDCPTVISQIQKAQMKILELIKWADLLTKQQEHEFLIQYQEQHTRQSQVLMKDVTQTLNKYNLIQLQNMEIFQQEKLQYDQSKTL